MWHPQPSLNSNPFPRLALLAMCYPVYNLTVFSLCGHQDVHRDPLTPMFCSEWESYKALHKEWNFVGRVRGEVEPTATCQDAPTYENFYVTGWCADCVVERQRGMVGADYHPTTDEILGAWLILKKAGHRAGLGDMTRRAIHFHDGDALTTLMQTHQEPIQETVLTYNVDNSGYSPDMDGSPILDRVDTQQRQQHPPAKWLRNPSNFVQVSSPWSTSHSRASGTSTAAIGDGRSGSARWWESHEVHESAFARGSNRRPDHHDRVPLHGPAPLPAWQPNCNGWTTAPPVALMRTRLGEVSHLHQEPADSPRLYDRVDASRQHYQADPPRLHHTEGTPRSHYRATSSVHPTHSTSEVEETAKVKKGDEGHAMGHTIVELMKTYLKRREDDVGRGLRSEAT
ncbi:hypothetical protein JAAARDRAFT_602766 [Jaapia argillacea MUCL 33604]|uniref:Uncharacterized protein n=1 Tax=Jaapia argillacea MUCL 33604 TaxID=933084 RepID=A0A067Q2E5_9AGAM|nr:hypothetical protein JAAARDRAFT_602766 [Jaapia argillacea MUCL 33604]